MIFSASSATSADYAILIVLAVLTPLIFLAVGWMLTRGIGGEKGVFSGKTLALLLLLGAAVRVALSFTLGGYSADFSVYIKAVRHFSASGPIGFIDSYGTDVYPLTFYILGIAGSLALNVGVTLDSAMMVSALKIPMILADIATMAIIYKASSKYLNSRSAIALTLLFAICPAFFIPSAVWGSDIVFTVPLILLSLYFLTSKKSFAAILFYGLSTLTSRIAIYLFPLYLVYFGYRFIISVKNNIGNKLPFQDKIKDAELSGAFLLPVYFLATVIIKYLISLPMATEGLNGNPFKIIYTLFLAPVSDLNYYGYNALSIYNLFGRNGSLLGDTFPKVVFAVCFGLLEALIVGVVYFSKKNRAVIALLSAFVLFTLITFYLDFSASDFALVTVLLLFSFIFTGDKRVINILTLSSVSYSLLSLSVLSYGGFFERADISSYSALVSDGAEFVLLIAATVISVITFVYFTLTLLDISMSGRRKVVKYQPGANLWDAVKDFIK